MEALEQRASIGIGECHEEASVETAAFEKFEIGPLARAMMFGKKYSNFIVDFCIEEIIYPGISNLVAFFPGSVIEGQMWIHLTKVTR